MIDPIMQLKEAIQNVDLCYYFVGDDNHRYAFCHITKDFLSFYVTEYPSHV